MKAILRLNDWPLAIKFLVAMILVALIPLAIVAFLNANNTQTALEEAIGNAFEQQAQQVSASLAEFVEKQVNVLEALSADDRLRTALTLRNERYTNSDEEIVARLLELDESWRNSNGSGALVFTTLSPDPSINPVTPSLIRFSDLFDEHIEVFITDVRGATVGATNMLSDYYQADEEWWQAAYNNGEGAVYISNPEFDDSANIAAILIAVPLFSEGDHGEVLGIIRSTIDTQSLVNKIRTITFGRTGRAMLLDRQGGVIADPHGNPELSLPADTVAHILEHNGHDIHAGEQGTPTLFGHQAVRFLDMDEAAGISTLSPRHAHIAETLDNLGWRVVIRQNVSEALVPVTTANRLAIFTVIIALFVAGGMAFGLARLLTRQLDKIKQVLAAINIGNYQARAEVISGDELGQVAASLNTVLDNTVNLIQSQEERDALQNSIVKLLEEVSDVAEGDLTVEAEVTADATGAIADSFNFMITQLRYIISNVQDATLQVSSSANEIQTTAEYLSQGSETQSSQILSTSVALDDMTNSIQQVSENAALSATVAEQALTNAKKGATVVQDTIEGMNRLRNQVQETARRIARLGESSRQIGNIVQLINEIADQTSFLALNASIQAARAGKAGQGFVVVAEEVESLAARSSEATQQIAGLVKTIQSETDEVVNAMEASIREAAASSQLTDQAGQALAEIENVAIQMAQLIQTISEASKQQAHGSEAIARSMNEIAEITQQTAAGTREAATSIRNLAGLADELRGSVSAFRLPATNGHGS